MCSTILRSRVKKEAQITQLCLASVFYRQLLSLKKQAPKQITFYDRSRWFLNTILTPLTSLHRKNINNLSKISEVKEIFNSLRMALLWKSAKIKSNSIKKEIHSFVETANNDKSSETYEDIVVRVKRKHFSFSFSSSNFPSYFKRHLEVNG